MSAVTVSLRPQSRISNLYKYIRRHWFLYLLTVPGLICLLVFSYWPMYGVLLSFKEFTMGKTILEAPWAKNYGFEHFIAIFSDEKVWAAIRNTLLINAYTFIVNFPFVIFLALMLNEIKNLTYKRIMQTFVYLPNFINWVVFGGLVMLFLSPSEGPLGGLFKLIFGKPVYMLTSNYYFRSVLVVSGLIKNAGFSTIIYLAGLAGVNPELYESAIIDGANRFHLNWHINLPRLLPTIAVLFILNVAQMFSSNFDQVYNLYNARVYESGDVISTYIYRIGIGANRGAHYGSTEVPHNYERTTALGLVFSIFSLFAIIYTNKFVRKMNVTGIF